MTVYVQSSLKQQFAFHSVFESELHWRLKMTDSSVDYNQGYTDPNKGRSGSDHVVNLKVRDQTPNDVVSTSLTMKPIKHRCWWRISKEIDVNLEILWQYHIVLVTGYATVGRQHSKTVAQISNMWQTFHQRWCVINITLIIFNRDFKFSFSIFPIFQFFEFLFLGKKLQKRATIFSTSEEENGDGLKGWL